MKAKHESERWMLAWLHINVCWDLWINLGKAIWARTNQLTGRIGKVVLSYPERGFVPSDQSLTIRRKCIKAWQQEPEERLISVVRAAGIDQTTKVCQGKSVTLIQAEIHWWGEQQRWFTNTRQIWILHSAWNGKLLLNAPHIQKRDKWKDTTNRICLFKTALFTDTWWLTNFQSLLCSSIIKNSFGVMKLAVLKVV